MKRAVIVAVMHRIKDIATISLCSFLLISCAATRNDCPLAGKWRSNKEATVEQMDKHGNVPQELRPFFLGMFGKLILEYTCSTLTSYSDDILVAKDMKYKIIKREGNLFEIKYHAPELLRGVKTMQITLVGDCYYTPVGRRFGFSEVFCRVE